MKSLNCRRWQSDLVGLVEGTLEKEEERKAEKHLEECARCQEKFLRLQNSHEMLVA